MYLTTDELKKTAKPAAFRTRQGRLAEAYILEHEMTIETDSGNITGHPGDALLTGSSGKLTLLDRGTFGDLFEALEPAKDVSAPFDVRGRA